MNIMVVHDDPVVAARVLCDQHVVKMPIEAAQMLCGVMRGLDLPAPWEIGRMHEKHPCYTWLCADRPARRGWLLRHAIEMCHEHARRFDHTELAKAHGVLMLADYALRRRGLANDEPVDWFAEAFQADFKHEETGLRPSRTVEAYRSYMDWKRERWAEAGRPMRFYRIELEPNDPAPWR